MKQKKTLILGAGFIGGNLARALVKEGTPLRIFTRPTLGIKSIEDILDKVELVYGDFQDDVALRQVTQDVDTVYHLISTTFPSMTLQSSVYDVLSNLLPTIRLVEYCADQGVKKIVYASSGGTIYGETQNTPVKEDHPLVPKSAYGQSKSTIENYLQFYSRSLELDVGILRISNPYGPGQNPFGVQGLVGVAMGCAQKDRVLKIYENGETIRDYIYIDDVVRAMQMEAAIEGSHVVNISSGEGKSVLEMVQLIEQTCGKTIQKESIAGRPGDVQYNVLCNDLAKELYGWTPDVSLKQGLEKTWQWITAPTPGFNT